MSKLIWKTEKRKVRDLIPAGYNPRKITTEKEKALINSLKKFNMVDIPCINKDNTVLSGNQRIKALATLGRLDEQIDCRIPNRQLTEQEAKEYMLIANTHAGEFDAEILEAEFSEIEIDFDIPVYEEPKPKKLAPLSTIEKGFFLSIKCEDESHCQELYDRLSAEGLQIRIVT